MVRAVVFPAEETQKTEERARPSVLDGVNPLDLVGPLGEGACDASAEATAVIETGVAAANGTLETAASSVAKVLGSILDGV